MESRDKKDGNMKSNKWILFGFILTIGLVLVFVIGYFLNVQSSKKPENISTDQAVSTNEIENGILRFTTKGNAEPTFVALAGPSQIRPYTCWINVCSRSQSVCPVNFTQVAMALPMAI